MKEEKMNWFRYWFLKRNFKRMYTHLVKSGKSSAEALQTAQQYMVVMDDIDGFMWLGKEKEDA